MDSDVKGAVRSIEEQVREVRKQLQPLLDAPLDTLVPSLSTADRVRLQVAVAYAINSIFHAFLKTQGELTEDHPVHLELERLRHYLKKVKEQDKARIAANATADASRKIAMNALGKKAEEAEDSGKELKKKKKKSSKIAEEEEQEEEKVVEKKKEKKEEQEKKKKKKDRKEEQEEEQEEEAPKKKKKKSAEQEETPKKKKRSE